MSKGTIILFFILTVIATLLLGINIGKKISNRNYASSSLSPTPPISVSVIPSPSPTISQTEITPEITKLKSKNSNSSTSKFTDESCGYTFTIPGSYIKSTSENGKSTIITDPENPQAIIAATCAETLPRPPLAADKIEAYTLDGKSAILYHDKTPEGNPRDEVIVKHPNRNLEIIIAGYGPIYEQVLSSFKFNR